jgi:hypothetical protein
MKHPKFTQIAIGTEHTDDTTYDNVYALDATGEVYIYAGDDGWVILDQIEAEE